MNKLDNQIFFHNSKILKYSCYSCYSKIYINTNFKVVEYELNCNNIILILPKLMDLYETFIIMFLIKIT